MNLFSGTTAGKPRQAFATNSSYQRVWCGCFSHKRTVTSIASMPPVGCGLAWQPSPHARKRTHADRAGRRRAWIAVCGSIRGDFWSNPRRERCFQAGPEVIAKLGGLEISLGHQSMDDLIGNRPTDLTATATVINHNGNHVTRTIAANHDHKPRMVTTL